MKRKIYIVGIGLIGGSFALEIRNIYPQSEIIGIDESEDNLNQAIELNLIDDKSEIDKILMEKMLYKNDNYTPWSM